MRTLQTQMRLRRVLRVHAQYQQRLREDGKQAELTGAAASRLLQLLRDVRAAWAQESAAFELGGLRTHLSRSLSAMEAAAAGLERPGADLSDLEQRFRDAGLPLVFFLRGLDDSGEPLLAELVGAQLARSA
jgi:hypothetical protein